MIDLIDFILFFSSFALSTSMISSLIDFWATEIVGNVPAPFDNSQNINIVL